MKNYHYYKEIKKFNQLSKNWWSEKKFVNNLQIINPVRLKIIKKNCYLYNKKILDFGSGGGLLINTLKKYTKKITAIDLSTKLINQSKKKINQKIIYNKEIKKKKYDIITCMEVIEHLPNYKLIINKLENKLNKNGLLFLSTLDKNKNSFLFSILIAEHTLKIIPLNTHCYTKFIKINNIIKYLKKKFTIKNIYEIKYNPIENSATYNENNKLKTNYIICAMKN